jgi:hypothetical protein
MRGRLLAELERDCDLQILRALVRRIEVHRHRRQVVESGGLLRRQSFFRAPADEAGHVCAATAADEQHKRDADDHQHFARQESLETFRLCAVAFRFRLAIRRGIGGRCNVGQIPPPWNRPEFRVATNVKNRMVNEFLPTRQYLPRALHCRQEVPPPPRTPFLLTN